MLRDLIGIESLIGFLTASIPGFFFWCYNANECMSAKFAGALLILSIVCAWFAIMMWLKTPPKIEEHLLDIKPIKMKNTKNGLIIILKPNKLLFMDELITIFENKDGFEEFIAVGKVTHIQENNKAVQLTVIASDRNLEEVSVGDIAIKIGLSAKYFELT